MDRRANAGYLAAPIAVSVLADLSVVLFYSVAAGTGIPYLRTALHKLVTAMFIFNAIALPAWLLEKFGNCRADIFFQVGGFAGEYYSVLLVCVVLFRSLVLNKRPLSRTGEIAILTLAFTCFTSGGIAGALLGGNSCQYSPTSTENETSRRPYVIFLGLGLGFALLLSALFVAVVLIFRTSRKSMDIPERLRVPHSGAMAVGANVRQDAELLSKRLVMYPIIMLVTGGVAVATATINDPTVATVGAIFLTLSGLINAVAFFALDPTARKVSTSLLQLLYEDDRGNGGPSKAQPPHQSHYKRMSDMSVVNVDVDGRAAGDGAVSPHSGRTTLRDRSNSVDAGAHAHRGRGSSVALFVARRMRWFLRLVARAP
ncbi:hypothetical protein M427DRAFT_140336 [Gonapodya prolifera JEL478]|uniref:G-protein coupled receptors family 1 profile domain-containing protein n=1 Tax=Gonapodya prolifera (strain JEL478) TaxID=1344416 RepID=A0A138ZZC3_GONPJ|nr:hypothetical protein M427DRAFT_140336 [Gonapodya prolifera JEL478]|eukprot:KXS09841.1 hypothetical protein M427DRAFT_140336 [Gonapodya prolifera JEL478]